MYLIKNSLINENIHDNLKNEALMWVRVQCSAVSPAAAYQQITTGNVSERLSKYLRQRDNQRDNINNVRQNSHKSKTLAMNLLNFQNLACQAFSNFRIILKFSNEKL